MSYSPSPSSLSYSPSRSSPLSIPGTPSSRSSSRSSFSYQKTPLDIQDEVDELLNELKIEEAESVFKQAKNTGVFADELGVSYHTWKSSARTAGRIQKEIDSQLDEAYSFSAIRDLFNSEEENKQLYDTTKKV